MTIPPVRKEVLVKTSPEHAFKVFAAGDWFPPHHTIIRNSKRKQLVIEPRADGGWYESAEDGSRHDWGKVLAWDPPRRMVLGWQLNGYFQYDTSAMTELEINFVPEGESTRVKLEHRGFERYGDSGQSLHDSVGSPEGWSGILQKFAEAAVPGSAATRRHFVCKLIPPRITFMSDMTEAEGAALSQHIEYWTALTKIGRAVLFGPVDDPAGVWGLGIISAADEEEARQIAEGDPGIKAGVGFKHEVYPMLRTVLAAK